MLLALLPDHMYVGVLGYLRVFLCACWGFSLLVSHMSQETRARPPIVAQVSQVGQGGRASRAMV